MSFAQDMKARLAALDVSVFRRFADSIVAGAKWLARPPRSGGHPMVRFGGAPLPLSAIVTVAALVLLWLFLDMRAHSAALVWAIDGWSIRAARQLPDWIVAVFNELTDFGKSGWFLWPAGIALLVIAAIAAAVSSTRMSRLVLATLAVRLEFVFLAVAVPGIVTNIIKRFFGRGRPFVGGDVDVYLPFDSRAAYASLPSGHATTAFSVLVALGALFPQWRPYLWGYAIVIAISRVVVTAHHPSDVLAGAVVGTLGALLVRHWFATRRRAFSVDPQGIVRPMAGPPAKRIKTVARTVTGQ